MDVQLLLLHCTKVDMIVLCTRYYYFYISYYSMSRYDTRH